jgi:hypothetical protein
MSELASQSTQQLFSKWRTGDAAAGQAMAQRFSDWYYAISASRLGDANCRPALQRACQRFAQGVASVTESGKLPDWAHGIIAEEIAMAGGRTPGGDHPNALTGHRSPTELLKKVRTHLTDDQVQLLAATYEANRSLDEVKRLSAEHGGYPLAVLEARYALKKALKQHEAVGFSELPERPNLDWGPLPLYEGARMSEGKEEKAFETWMLTDLSLCKDIAEFAAFALALRGGAFRTSAAPQVSRPTPPPPRPEKRAVEADEPAQDNKMPLIIGGVAVGALLVIGLIFAVLKLL